jgi:glycosyltransferase involved in cell wall biosynthesis
MRILLIGPHPPPHGGISVHVSGIHRQLMAAGVTCHVLDMSLVRPGFGFGWTVLRHALRGWTLHLHTNGHNVKSWLLALGCGLAGQFRGGSILTLHSGMVSGYLLTAPGWRRKLAALTCSLYTQVLCAGPETRSALLALGVDAEVLPAFLNAGSPDVSPESGLTAWIERHRPLFSTVLFFRPEYGFDLLIAALVRLRRLYPSLGCLVMGSGEQRAEAERRIREAGLEESVLLLGDVPHDACLALMSAGDVFLRPTLADGDSISVREALALGIPVAASRVVARPAGAILFRPGDVEEMLAAVELGLAAKRSNPPRAAGSMDRLMEIYRQVDGSQGRAATVGSRVGMGKLKHAPPKQLTGRACFSVPIARLRAMYSWLLRERTREAVRNAR